MLLDAFLSQDFISTSGATMVSDCSYCHGGLADQASDFLSRFGKIIGFY